MTSYKPFNILDSEHRDKLNPDGGSHGKHEGSYHCPVCDAKNFKVNLKTGQYNGYNCTCMTSKAGRQAIIDAISPSTWRKPKRLKQHRSWLYHDGQGQPLLRVHRRDEGEGNRRFWQKSIQDGEPRDLRPFARPYQYFKCLEAIDQEHLIFWVEGEPCADALWNLGIPATTTISGTNSYRSEQYRDLFPAESLVICPDRDQVGLKYAEAIAADYPEAQWCYAYPTTFLWQRLPQSDGADMADWIGEGATKEDILQAVGKQRQDVAAFDATHATSKEDKKASKPNRFKRHYDALYALWGNRLRFNQLTKSIELDEKSLTVGDAKVILAVEQNLDISLNNLELMLSYQAKLNTYHPIQDYLIRCYAEHQQTKQDTAILTTLAERYFGVSGPLYNTYLRRTLIAAVQ
ncbi:MAG: hypothetical protein AAGJ50_07465, partial [Pseudomonadota bacterium]